jgi:hypothetical protein
MSITHRHSLEFPEGLDGSEWEAAAKGWLKAKLVADDTQYTVTFYDPTRLLQTIESELQSSVAFFERNLIVVPSVTRAHMEAAITLLIVNGRQSEMTPDGEPGDAHYRRGPGGILDEP